ncbi:MAG: type II toxin-antitoxin system death-on-curing family toxin, partial [Paracoccaceae bacterium]|nr:type II toxin-antitoxin system death-on-curing family toxin [Paracoccaceae bacterium]
MHYRVTWQDAIEAHRIALMEGGLDGVRAEGQILAALARPYHGYHRWIYQKAAALVHGIITSHGFVDGNKRTALYLVLKLVDKCRAPRYVLVADNAELVQMFVSVANGNSGYGDLVCWFHRS